MLKDIFSIKGSGTKEGVQSETIQITFKKLVTKLMKNVSIFFSLYFGNYIHEYL